MSSGTILKLGYNYIGITVVTTVTVVLISSEVSAASSTCMTNECAILVAVIMKL